LKEQEPIVDDFQRALELMAESINHMKVGRHQRDIIRAGMKCACEYAQMRRAGFELSEVAKARNADTTVVN